MRYWVLILLVLVWTLPNTAKAILSDVTCQAHATDYDCLSADYDTLTAPKKAALVNYLAVFTANPGIATAMEYRQLPQSYRTDIWDVMYASYVTGVADLPKPAEASTTPYALSETHPDGYIQYVHLTRAEAENSYAAKVAHALYLEVNSLVPWSLDDLSDEEYLGLFNPDELYTVWDPTHATQAVQFPLRFYDHSPARVYDIASPLIGTPTTAAQALSDLLEESHQINESATYPLQHIAQNWPLHAVSIDEMLNVQNSISGHYISRGGCVSSSEYMKALSRSLNIPAFEIWGYFAGANHTGASFPSVDGVLAHGDDLYNALLQGTVGAQMLDLYSCWDAHMDNYGIGPEDDPINRKFSYRLQIFKSMQYISPYVEDWFCSPSYGWAYIEDNYGFAFEPCEQGRMDQWYYDLAYTTGCDGGGGP